jgi:hypothetical protein
VISLNEDDPKVTRIKISGPTLEESRVVFAEYLDKVLAGPSETALLDLSEVMAIQSAWLGRILMYYKHFAERGKKLRVLASAPLYEMLRLIKLNTVIPTERAGTDGGQPAAPAGERGD